MSGLQNALAASGNAAAFAMGAASTGTGAGYRSSGTGTLSPAAFRGATVVAIESTIDPAQMFVTLTGVVSQSIFREVLVSSGGTVSRFLSASATYSNPGGNSRWLWTAAVGGGSAIVFADGVSARLLVYY
jgi:hypothetical protein